MASDSIILVLFITASKKKNTQHSNNSEAHVSFRFWRWCFNNSDITNYRRSLLLTMIHLNGSGDWCWPHRRVKKKYSATNRHILTKLKKKNRTTQEITPVGFIIGATFIFCWNRTSVNCISIIFFFWIQFPLFARSIFNNQLISIGLFLADCW